MLRHYFEVKAQHPEAILLYRVGDFYECYSDDAITAVRVLGLVQTKKSNGDKGPVAMAGFPHHALENYLTKLVRAGFKVAICDQLEDPKFAKKLVKRGVTEIVTPGISFGENMLEVKENNFLCGLTVEKDCCGAAFLDVSTGQFQIAQGSLDYIATLLGSFKPKELVVQRGYEKASRSAWGTISPLPLTNGPLCTMPPWSASNGSWAWTASKALPSTRTLWAFAVPARCWYTWNKPST